MEKFSFLGEVIRAGSKKVFDYPVPDYFGIKGMSIPIMLKAGKKPGPTVLLISTVHGDEINGMRVCHRVYNSKRFQLEKGLLVILPVANIYGFLNRSRYLPDRRDLNRSFPGGTQGPLASRLANLLLDNFVTKANFVIDLHTGAKGRFNIPQIRLDIKQKAFLEILPKLDIPIIMHSETRESSLRLACEKNNIPCIVYEAGEADRTYDDITKKGVSFVESFLIELLMLPRKKKLKRIEPIMVMKSRWIRASTSGIFIPKFTLGKVVSPGQVLAEVRTVGGRLQEKIKAKKTGVIIGYLLNPLIIEGDALFHIGFLDENLDEPIEEMDYLDDYLLT